jgi:transcription-repair coupling factor (superfamily II helicase)
LRDTVRRELARGGQVYVVVPRISAIERAAADVGRLVPEAIIASGHGRMGEGNLEAVMMDFIEGRYNVLISTTIIESGIDIPNVNTILILDADWFGLSQLYQLRGRVGRRDRIAFAYLLFRRDKALTEDAQKRLRTIREFTEFGAGFKIAMRDLEIRGAGNLLGAQQHGHMAAVGYELYCRMVDDAVRALLAEEGADGQPGAAGAPAAADETEVRIDLPVTAYIPEGYVEDEALRLEAYRDASLVATDSDLATLASDLADRFGTLPEPAKSLLRVALARNLAKAAGLERVHTKKNDIIFLYASVDRFDPTPLPKLAEVFGDRFLVSGTTTPALRLHRAPHRGSGPVSEEEMEDVLELLRILSQNFS